MHQMAMTCMPPQKRQARLPRTHNDAMTRRPENLYANYHAHVYFCADTVAKARQLREDAAAQLPASIGRFHEKPVGPHPHWSFQMAFDSAMFDQVIAWLAAHRD